MEYASRLCLEYFKQLRGYRKISSVHNFCLPNIVNMLRQIFFNLHLKILVN